MNADYSHYLKSLTRLVGLDREKEKKLEAFRSEQQKTTSAIANQESQEKTKIQQKLSSARSQLTEFMRKSQKRMPPQASGEADGADALGFDDARVEFLRVLLKLEKLYEAEKNDMDRRDRERAKAAAEALSRRNERLVLPEIPQVSDRRRRSSFAKSAIIATLLVASVVATSFYFLA